MIKNIRKENWKFEKTQRVVKCKVADRICDECGKVEKNQRYANLLLNKRRRKSDKDYCSSCANKMRKPQPVGNQNGQWEHGRTYHGYVRINVDRKRVLEHVYVMGQKLGRPLKKGETIHHVDLDKTNNVIENLWLAESHSKHLFCHSSMEKCGLKFLDKLIWFDYDAKVYVLEKNDSCNRLVPNIEMPRFELRKGIVYNKEYWFCKIRNDRGHMKERGYHLLIAEKMIGRQLYKNEYVHHINENTLDCNPSNLFVMTSSEHGLAHYSLQECVASLYKKGIVSFKDGVYF